MAKDSIKKEETKLKKGDMDNTEKKEKKEKKDKKDKKDKEKKDKEKKEKKTDIKDKDDKKQIEEVIVIKNKGDDNGATNKKITIKEPVEDVKGSIENSSSDEDSNSDNGSESDGDSGDSGDSDSSSDSGSGDSEESYISMTSEEILENDPLYFILSKFFISSDGKNIADILQEINKKIE